MKAGRPKTKVLKTFKKLDPKFKVKLNSNTTVYVRSLEIMETVWRPLYPDLEVIE